ncbi:MAG: tetratricopeptide repeat protein [Coriobacteriia bacterium]|nr:tetratricopeptide repeat protein [Coriobacteriia bacterium]
MNEDLAKDLTLEEFRRFRDLLHSQSGIYLEESKFDSLRISLVARATRLGYATMADYYTALARDHREFNELLNLVTINETSFFRFPGQFDALRARVLPEVMANKTGGNRALRIWSAGCSTGEEPYSISMTLIDAGVEALGYKPQVLGTDVSTKALARAKAGIYGKRAMMNVSEDVVGRYFEPTASGDYRVNERVRGCVDFGYQNLIKEPYPLSLMGSWDVIFCRNVTIYFRLESTRRVVANLYDSLNEGGYLFIGHSETLTSINDDFEAVEVDGVFLYRKPSSRKSFALGNPLSSARGPRVAKPVPDAGVAPTGLTAESARDISAAEVEELLVKARANLREGRPQAVLETVEEVLAADHNNAEAHLLSAYVHADAGDYDEAMHASSRALAINPLLPVAHYILGIIYQRRGDTVRAVSELKKAIYIDADFVLAHLNLANMHKAQRKWESAAREYENALKALRSSPDGSWTEFSGGFQADLLVRTCERSLIECRKAMGDA